MSLECLERRRLLAAAIEITEVPAYGSGGAIRGQVSGVDPADYRVAPYIQIEGAGWWTKPTFANPTVPINADGTFQVNIGAGDSRATIFSAALVPTGTVPPRASGAGRIPDDLISVAIDHEQRFARTLQFAGRTWAVKQAPNEAGPGGNRFTSGQDDVFVDAEGKLHLTIKKLDANWWSTEVFLVDPLGYGTYSFQTDSSLYNLDANVTFGAFTWDPFGDDETGADPHREIDFEDGRWGNAGNPTNAQMVVQPFDIPGNLRRYTIPDQSGESTLTRIFNWQPDQIEFVALVGAHDPAAYPQDDVIDEFTYVHNPSLNHYVPTAGQAGFRFNLWLNTGSSPLSQQPIEVVISDFAFDGLKPPSDITLSNTSIAENTDTSAAEVTIGTLSTIDADFDDTHTYTLVSGIGSADNESFTINGNELRVKQNTGLDYETQNRYSVRVRSTDNNGLSMDKSFTVTVADVNDAPTLTSIGAPVDTTAIDTETELTIAELVSQGDEADVDGTVTAFVVKSVSSGSLKIGLSAAAATPFAAGSNDTIDAANHAYWTPAAGATGLLNAFEVVAEDDGGLQSATPITVHVIVSRNGEDPVIEITEVPEYGTFGFFRGQVSGIEPADYADYEVAGYIHIEGFGWYTKPTFASPTVPINADGTFQVRVASGIDSLATVFYAALVPAGYVPPLAARAEQIPGDLLSVASDIELTVVNEAPTLTSIGSPLDTTVKDTEVEVTFAELTSQGDEADVDGTVTAFVVKSVSSGSLKIGVSAATATPFAAGSNDTIDAANHAYWTPAAGATGLLNAFGVVAQDNGGLQSATPVSAQINVIGADPVIEITEVPQYGTFGFFRGQLSGVEPADYADYRVAGYIYIEGSGWWTKPTFASPTVPIKADGTFEVRVAAGVDNLATVFYAALVPAGYVPPLAARAEQIPGDLLSVASDIELTVVNEAPTLTSIGSPLDTTVKDTEVEVTFAELTSQGDQADVDGTVTAFVVKSVSSGSLKIGVSAATATPFVAGSNDTLDAANHAYWTPAAGATGLLNAFGVVAQDNGGLESATPVIAQINVIGDPIGADPVIEITEVPQYGTFGFFRGQVSGVEPADYANYRVAGYIYIVGSGWWTKPTFASPTVPINVDGTFEVRVAAGLDNLATVFYAALVPAGYVPPRAAGAGQIPGDLQRVAVDIEVTAVTVNEAPTLSSIGAPLDTTVKDTEVEVTFAELALQGDEADVDGTVTAFVVKSVASGSLKIGASAATATLFAAGSNDTIDAANHAYWTPAAGATGLLNAFGVVAQDNGGLQSATPVSAQINVIGADPVIEITEVPEYGTFGFFRGQLSGVEPADYADYRVAGYIYIEGLGWYTKPTFASPTVPINADGTFEVRVAAGVDNLATVFYAALVPAGYVPPLAARAEQIPGDLLSVASDIQTRALPLLASGNAANSLSTQVLALSDVEPLMENAIAAWAAVGISVDQRDRLESLQISIADLSGARLGEQFGNTITLDVNAAGYGWHIDSTDPHANGIDPLTVIYHEMGHAIGMDDDYSDPSSDDIMNGWLLTNTRRIPAVSDVDVIFSEAHGSGAAWRIATLVDQLQGDDGDRL